MNHRQSLLTLLFAALIATALITAPRAAWAHAVLLKSTPAMNETVSGPALTVSLKFNSRVDAAKSSFSVVDPAGHSKPIALDKQKAPDTVSGNATGLTSGKYAIHWQVLSVDGHITRGQIPFEVK